VRFLNIRHHSLTLEQARLSRKLSMRPVLKKGRRFEIAGKLSRTSPKVRMTIAIRARRRTLFWVN